MYNPKWIPAVTALILKIKRTGRPVLAALLVGVLLSLGFGSAKAAGEGSAASAWHQTDQSALRLIAATETTGDADTLILGLHFKLKPGWKIYWRSPGDAGFPPQPEWKGSENLKHAVIHWPAPERFSVIGLETLGYKKEVVFPLTVTRADPSRPLRMSGIVRYLTCDDICIPYDAEVALTLPRGPAEETARPSPFAHLISRYQSQVPVGDNRHGLRIETAETWGTGKDVMLRVKASATMPFQAPDLFPEGPPELTFSKPTVRLGPDRRTATLEIKVFGAKYLPGPDKSLAGKTLTVTLVDGNRGAEKRLDVIAGDGRGLNPGASTPIALILLFALLGGLILNLMPCVLPVLSIKLLGVVGHGGGERRLVRLSFLASAAGILFAFMVLAAALIILKTAGMTVGWGIQFQQPWFLVAMTLLVTAFACNLWGFFEVRLPGWVADMGEHAGHAHGLGGHFLQGAFATLLATPCSAPFLGTAIGFALARGGVEISAVFAALGIGLSLPYLTVATFPGLATRLPKPGPWMVTMKRVLGFALAATGVWLLSVLAISIGLKAAVGVGVLAAAAAGLLYLGHIVPDGAGRRAPLWMAVAAVAAFMVPGWLGDASGGAKNFKETTQGTGSLDRLWTPFDEAAIAKLVSEGHTVFVDVTAEWCLTCQINKAFVLNKKNVLAAFQGEKVVVMKADWTRPDPMISDFLARHQRYGIPFDVVYGPGAPTGIVLPELLSQDTVLDAFKQATLK
ncbi:MAG: Thiol:disulfide interchange protein DsbD [Alphaproteobacteria bacterium MarineAlpha3_Bin2]|jgi:suppressor for copper-sensitivity B|nr:MAG: Thiol:disulfide interchange protein DsbD [Alphaproteobacteria bacterium MarineAlpha3_Bin1]PPR73476.1 MAG: Thiol:disulfide interchange protein DsbD [Alphaproteobacteria bacterium MarineAlpha3_Bin2]